MSATTVNAKYIYLDVVGYSRGRTVEAQTDITDSLNQIVKQAVSTLSVSSENVIYIPTGDGICIGLLGVHEPYDIDMELALAILENVHDKSNAQTDNLRKFAVRIAVNENVDNSITDVNGRKNVAGAGINLAQRILSLGDAGNLLVGQSVHDRLAQREKYHERFTEYHAIVKHGEIIRVYQLVDQTILYLNSEAPLSLRPRVEPRFTKLVAYFVGFLAKHKDFIAEHANDGPLFEYPLFAWMAAMALDSAGKSEQTETRKQWSALLSLDVGVRPTPENYLERYRAVGHQLLMTFRDLFNEHYLPPYSGYFEWPGIYVTREGVEKLKREWPDIVKELEL